MYTGTSIAFLRFIFICNPKRFRYVLKLPNIVWAFNIFFLPYVASSVLVWYNSPLPNSILSTTCVNIGRDMAKVVFEYQGNY